MDSGVVFGEVKSAGEMLDLLVNFENPNGLLFRGQQEPWPLLFKIARPAKQRDKDKPILELERRIFEDFRWLGRSHARGDIEDNPWEWLAVARHYDVRTRLLDWTTNPLAALWFAVREAPVSDKPGIVWMFLPDEEAHMKCTGDPFKVKETLVFRPSHITPRIIAQSGWFTVHEWIPEKESYKCLGGADEEEPAIFRIQVPKASFAGIRVELARLDIHSASMFPDLGGLGRHVEWLHIESEDE